jgi:hypothetical protein
MIIEPGERNYSTTRHVMPLYDSSISNLALHEVLNPTTAVVDTSDPFYMKGFNDDFGIPPTAVGGLFKFLLERI